ncbi:MAG: hypothetical protein KGL39_06680 [Patescibacteria group bacterium]|nr:hypothetical protein [Patescibacteria group bacterium]
MTTERIHRDLRHVILIARNHEDYQRWCVRHRAACCCVVPVCTVHQAGMLPPAIGEGWEVVETEDAGDNSDYGDIVGVLQSIDAIRVS